MGSDKWNRHRYDNTVRVIERMWRSSGISRAEIARSLRLDRSTVGAIVDNLIEMNIAQELPVHRTASGGRPAVPVVLNADFGCSIGIEVDERSIRLVATDLSGEVTADHHVERLPGGELIEEIVSTIRGFRREREAVSQRILSVGVGIPGIVNSKTGQVSRSRALGISSTLDLGSLVEEAVALPVTVLNDADACALGELEYGTVGEDLLFVLVRYRSEPFAVNAGLGIVLDGRLREAHSGAGREFRSPFVDHESSDQFDAATRWKKGEISDEGSLHADFAEELGAATASIVHALDLRNIVLGGDVLLPPLNPRWFEESLRYHVQTGSDFSRNHPPLIVRPTEPDRMVSFGASAGALRRLFHTRKFPVGLESGVTRKRAVS